MTVIKKSGESVNLEQAHGGSGSRKLFVNDTEIKNYQGVTYGYLPSGNMYAWHNHDNVNEIMFVIKGTGTVRDADGEYDYKPGDFFIFPKGVFHEIKNTCEVENEYFFVRVFDL